MDIRRMHPALTAWMALCLGAGWAVSCGSGRLRAQEPPVEPAREMTRGDAEILTKRGRYGEAADVLLSLLRKQPDDKRLLFDCVAVLSWAERYRESADLAVDYPRNRPPQYSLDAAALAFRRIGQYDRALECYRDGCARYPGVATFMLGQILTLADAGSLDEADALIQAFPGTYGRSPDLADAEEYTTQKRAMEAFDRRRARAVDRARAGRHDAALASLAALEAEYPGHPGLGYDRVAILSWAGRHDEVLRAVPDPAALDGAPDYVQQAVAVSLREAGDFARAATLYRSLLKASPESAVLAEGLALTLAAAGQVDEAAALVDRYASGSDPTRMAAAADAVMARRRDEAAALAAAGRFDEAIRRLEALRRFRPGHAGTDYDLVTTLSWAGRHAEAVRQAEGVDMDSAPAYARQALAVSLRETGAADRAENLYRRLVAEAPDNAVLAEGLILTLVKAGNIDEAEALFTRHAGAGAPPRMDAAAQAILAFRRDEAANAAAAGQYDEAVKRLQRLRDFRPGHAGTDYDLLTTLSWAGRHAEAARLAKDLDLDAAPAYTRQAAAASLRHEGDLSRAEALYRRLAGESPDNAAAAEGLALTLIKAERTDEAEPFAARGGPDAVAALLAARREAAVRQARAGAHESAVQALDALSRRHPDQPGILHDQITVLSWAERYAEALALAARINLAAAPEYALEAVAASLRKTGRPERARVVYERALTMFPDSVGLTAGLAMSLVELGEHGRAEGVLDAFAARRPDADPSALAEARGYLSEPPPLYETPPRTETPYRAEQDALVAGARDSGQTEAARDRLAALYRAHPDDVYLLGDYLVLLNWSKDHEAAVLLARKLDLSLAHDYVVQTVAGSLMALGRHYTAHRFLKEVIAAQRGNPELMAVAGMMMIQGGDLETGLDYLHRAKASRAPGMGNRLKAIHQRIGGDYIKAMLDLDLSQQALAENADDDDARRRGILAANAMGSHRHALALSVVSPDEPAPEQRRQIALDAAREKIPWGEQAAVPRDLDDRVRQLCAALTELNALWNDTGTQATPELLGGIGGGKARSLYELNRASEALREYEQVRGLGAVFSDGDLLAVAGAYLAVRCPAESKAVYLEVLARADGPKPPRKEDLYEAKKGLFWALLENEELAAALAQAERHYAEGTAPSGPDHYEAEDYRKTEVAIARGLALLYTGFLSASETHLRQVVADAPANAGALAALASAQNLREQPRASLETVLLARMHAPDDMGLAAQEAGLRMSLHDRRGARDLVERLEPYAGSAATVERLMRDWRRYNQWELRMDANWGHVLDGDDIGAAGSTAHPSLEARLYTPPIGDHWRVFAGAATGSGDFVEGHARQNLFLGGLEYRSPLLTASLEARADHVNETEFGLGLSGTLTPGDHWRFPFAVEHNSRNTPLRARLGDITADSADLGVGYQWNESRSLNLSLGGMDFSDGNQRFSAGGVFTQRLWSRYTRYLDGQLNAYTSHNSKDADRPYFNPKSDYELGVGLTYGSLLWRRYERSLSHTVSAGIGGYHQRYFGDDVIWNVGYGQSLSLSESFALDYGVGLRRRVYDGTPEHDINVFLSSVRRF